MSYLLCFILPITTLLFLTNGPYAFHETVLWTLPFIGILLVDGLNIEADTHQDDDAYNGIFYDGILYALSLLQLINIGLMSHYVSQLHWQTHSDILLGIVNLIALRFLVATSSGTSGIVVAHELIHRPQSYQQLLGRLLLCSVFYEHFVITHKRGHHLSLGMPEDIATARLNENFKDYWRRVYRGYWCYAWSSEQTRLGAVKGLARLFKNQVLHGLLIETLLLISIIVVFGWLAAVMFLYQAFAAVRILEAVNYFQHWGLTDSHYGNTYGWVSNSWLTRHVLMGLSHHIGHHQDENKRFYEISYSDAGPKMPYGYFVMNLWIKLDNASYQKMAMRELQRYNARH
ncbi:fatty acid desaturase [Crenothrix sp.]|uniref:fatty acid desaturase n=1 Tax=Crenothrix sp. TaxID=3100433 RepID=UPI00374D80C0